MIVNIAFWIFVLAMDLLIPGVMIGFGKEFQKNPPTEIDPGYGYRTSRSMKNKLTWDFAQKYMCSATRFLRNADTIFEKK